MRLDRFLSNLPALNRQAGRLALTSGRVKVDGQVVNAAQFEVNQFSRIELDNQLLQAGKAARYFMLHKPVGVVSATQHEEHRTVLDLLDEPDKTELHLAGRLDLNTSGLLIITNDGLWSRRLTEPRSRLGKVYRVHTEQPIEPHYAAVFAQGLYFAYEDLTTLPAELAILDSHSALLTLHEGRYHQVKRMFGHFQNKVIGLHRLSMGGIHLDPSLAPGQYRALTAEEIASC
ncbi:pseudouridine synthase [Pseudomonas sp. 5P_3.1_Bac2]|uniref:pseudouridine synthase n=1 Tax=Pseudomonas sp. 5P_3.1_Bac2 TaxID=2971617 RepID=UPI0021C5DEE2|nr:16S rRNA pseudouridine(516) synthase [Pseudomonas sp. 5P_3.1_Bac2]MCU1715903.1 16S rRNA pseudouridine(516) synthase [Pseudomonas sp. 5P_3.1_Bac2]